jgi:hypothetical protein
MKAQVFSSHGPHARRTAVFAVLGLAGLLVITVAAIALSERSWTKDRPTSPPTWQSATATRTTPGFWYIRSGQWRADVLTMVAMVRYLLEPEFPTPPGATSPLGWPYPTNVASVAPGFHSVNNSTLTGNAAVAEGKLITQPAHSRTLHPFEPADPNTKTRNSVRPRSFSQLAFLSHLPGGTNPQSSTSSEGE